MNKRRLLLTVLSLVLFLIKLGFAQEPVLPGVGFVSPNGRYCVQLEVTDGFLRFVIRDTKTERVDDSIKKVLALCIYIGRRIRNLS